MGNLTTTQKLVVLAIAWLLLSGGGSIGGGGKADAATYVWDKSQGGIPAAVLSGINKLNEQGIVATQFEQPDSGNIPDQYAVAFDAAKKAGLPSFVVTGGGKVLKVTKDPKTEEDVLKGVQ